MINEPMIAEPTLDATMTSVDELLARTLGQLDCHWSAIAQPGTSLLGDLDLPQLLGRFVGGGKRVRPAMAHWGWVAAGGEDDTRPQLIRVGAALELLHAFAVIHDDVMDRSPQRRGQPSCHVLAAHAYRQQRSAIGAEHFGDGIAILVGDLALSEADHLVGNLPREVRTTWRKMMVELILGQRADLTGINPAETLTELDIAQLKTGSYTVQYPLRMGGQLAAAAPATLAALDAFGQHLGRAYGVRDDYLGTFGDPTATGKPIDDDLASGKQTMVVLLADQRLSASGRAQLQATQSRSLSPSEIASLRQEMIDHGVPDAVEAVISAEVDAGLSALSSGDLAPSAIDALTAAAEQVRANT